MFCAVSVLEMNLLHLQNESLTDFAWSLLERIFPERQDQQEDLNQSGNVFCYPYQFPLCHQTGGPCSPCSSTVYYRWPENSKTDSH